MALVKRYFIKNFIQTLKVQKWQSLDSILFLQKKIEHHPHKIFKKLNIKKENIPNFDLEFAQAIANTPTILGYQFELTDKKYINKNTPSIQTIFIEKNKNKEKII